MRSFVPDAIYKPIPRNVLFYDGPSQLNGARILAIASAQNGNRKIGAMLQVWIIPAVSPLAALRSGYDEAVCGQCSMRGDGHGRERTCYVYMPGVDNIWQARQKATRMTPREFAVVTKGLQLRIGAYGDPAAVPMSVWRPLLETAGGWTAYTHQHRTAPDEFRTWCMASVESECDAAQAQARGWRTFRVRPVAGAVTANEIVCPHETDAEVHCAGCSLCRGAARPAKSIAVTVHGNGVKWFRSREAALEDVGEAPLLPLLRGGRGGGGQRREAAE